MASVFDPQHQVSNVDSKAVVALERLSEVFRVLLWNENRESGLSPIQTRIIVHILFHDKKPCTVSGLADEFQMTRATISDAVKTLEQKKLVRKVPDPEDSRSAGLFLTAKGRSLATRGSNFADPVRDAVRELPSKDRTALLGLLADLLSKLQERDLAPGARVCISCAHFKKSKSGRSQCEALGISMNVQDLRVDCEVYESATVNK